MKLNILFIDQYDREAVLAPSVVCCLIAFSAFYSYIPYQEILIFMRSSILLYSSIFSIILYCILILIMAIVRQISRKFVEHIVFGNNYEKIPTTEYLLHSSSFGNSTIAEKVRGKIKRDFDISLKTQASEEKDINSAKNTIAAAVALIRKKLQGSSNEMYNRKNRRYGICRNFIGAFYISSIVSIIALLFGVATEQSILLAILALAISITLFLLLFLFYKDIAKDYANELFESYLNL